MYGRSAAILTAVVALSCANVVSQDAASGPDGKIKGAKPITFDDQNQAHATGIVTYPGGDRVDWKTFDLPAKKRGKLDIKLTWQPPRPGEQLAFDVFDEWSSPVLSSKNSKKKSHSHTKTGTIDHASGKYFIRVYAVERDDAGKYKLQLDFKPEATSDIGWDPRKLDVQDPPPIAAVPGIECTPFTFDVKDPGCAKVCPKPASLAPEGWPPCAGECTKPDVTNPKCWDTMECPDKPNKHVKKCTPDKWPKCDLSKPDPENPNCPDHMPAVTARIVKREIVTGDLYITIGAGSEQGITKDWSAKVLQGKDGESPLSGGDVQYIKIEKNKIVGKVKLTQQQVDDNPRVKITPPAIR
jgi:hypothetical protein